jgi:ethanolamine permease
MLAYGMQAAAFLILRNKLPNIPRPYKSPWGVFGGWAALIISGIAFVGFLINPAFLPAIVGIAVVYLVMLLGFALVGRHNLVLSPEEEYALEARKSGS